MPKPIPPHPAAQSFSGEAEQPAPANTEPQAESVKSTEAAEPEPQAEQPEAPVGPAEQEAATVEVVPESKGAVANPHRFVAALFLYR